MFVGLKSPLAPIQITKMKKFIESIQSCDFDLATVYVLNQQLLTGFTILDTLEVNRMFLTI